MGANYCTCVERSLKTWLRRMHKFDLNSWRVGDECEVGNITNEEVNNNLLTYVRSWALPEKLPIVQPFRKFPAILRNPKVHRRVHKNPPLVPILSQFDPVPTIPFYLSKIRFNIVHPVHNCNLLVREATGLRLFFEFKVNNKRRFYKFCMEKRHTSINQHVISYESFKNRWK
jgi:hypothetical protein